MAAQMVSLYKCLGVRLVEIGEVCHRIITKLVLRSGGAHSKEACRSVKIYYGLKEGIERAIHAVKKKEDLGRVDTGEER